MIKIIKKNQLTILVLSLMLITAGYLNYNDNIQASTEIASIGDATLVSSSLSNSVNNNELQNEVTQNINNNNIIMDMVASSVSAAEESVQTSNETTDLEEYFSSSRIERDTMYSQMLESYQKIIDSSTTTEKQKTAAQEEIDNINKTKNAIMISENLIKTKGFKDIIIFLNDDSISVVIDKDELEKEDIAQIQSIIAREMNAKIDDIHIMNK